MTCFRVAAPLALAFTWGCAGKLTGECGSGIMAQREPTGETLSSLDLLTLKTGESLNICSGTWPADADVFVQGGGAPAIVGNGLHTTVLDADGGESVSVNGSGSLTVMQLSIRNAVEGCHSETGDFDCFTAGGGFEAYGVTTVLDGVALTGNRAPAGAAMYVGPDTTLTLRHGQVTSNSASIAGGGVALIYPGSMFISDNTDWGTGANDNTPDDVAILDEEGNVLKSYTFDGIASFTCTWDTRTCE